MGCDKAHLLAACGLAFSRMLSRKRLWYNSDCRHSGGPMLKETILRLLHRVQTPAQYIGGELHSMVKDHRQVRGKLCLAFPDLHTLGMSHHGLQVLDTLMNGDPQCACERVFAPWVDFEQLLRQHNLPLYSLETFTPL